MWRERIAELTNDAEFAEPADLEMVATAQSQLGGELPASLVELLLEANGVSGEYDLGLVWPLARIIEDNLTFRSNPGFAELYMPFSPLLFFADAGNGDQFAFVQTPRRDDVFIWNHEDDSRTWVAGSLDQYLQWWLDGTLRI